MKLPKHAEIWLPGYVASRFRRMFHTAAARRVWVSIADHYEPYWRNSQDSVALDRVRLWRERWPEIAQRHADSIGQPPQYTFFYPEEEYRPELLDLLAEIKLLGLGDVEVHLHHDHDTESAFIDKVSAYKQALHQNHGLLRKNNGEIVFGFIHGNWCLDNSHPEGRYCGLNNEITLLKQLGCYADFTMPCGPSDMQARLLNEIYWVVDDPAAPKSYDSGQIVKQGQPGSGDLLMIPGPWGLVYRDRTRLTLEIGELAHYNPLIPKRVATWFDVAPRVGSDIFIKIFTHGTQESTSQHLLSHTLDNLFEWVSAEAARRDLELHYVSAHGLYRAVFQACGGTAPH
jgi:hypothetical protein